MGSISKLEGEVETKSSADKIFKVINYEQHQLPNASSSKIHGVSVHEGSWENSGSIKIWKYTVDGSVEILKEKTEVDEENKIMTLTALEGSHMLNLYKSYKLIIRAIPKGEGSLVKITIEYEKLNQSVPDATKYLNFVIHVVKDTDAHILKP